MSQNISAVSLFCEDIRAEKTGTDILIGVLGDNMQIAEVPAALPKLGVYTRIVLPVNGRYREPMHAVMRFPDGRDLELGKFEVELINSTIREVKALGGNIAGFISKAVLSPFLIGQFGRIVMLLRIGKHERVSGHLNFIAPSLATPTANAPPS